MEKTRSIDTTLMGMSASHNAWQDFVLYICMLSCD
jgi:hypothetical protein